MSNPFSDVPPPLPPKQPSYPRRQQQQSHQPSRSHTRNDPSHTHHPSRSTDTPPRTRPNRSQTTGPPPAANTTSRPQPPQARRSHSSDSAPSDKAKSRSKAKKSSIHADVIDRLDFTGVGPMFHHDGPFDACAPSRNRNTTKAPIRAWTSINAEDEEVAARYRDKEDGLNPVAPALSYDSSYPSDVPRSPPAGANYNSYYSEPPKKKVDVIAEAWGMHEPEPYEEFFAGGGDPDGPITNGSSMKEARANGSGRRTREDLASRPRGSNHIPPPQPIIIAEETGFESYSPQSSASVGGANLGRNKSLMQRIRRMRDSPNVPFGFDERIDTPADGRFARGGRGDTSPTAPVHNYGFADDRVKELPATPASPVDGYFDGSTSPGGGLGRKTSILKKVRGVVYRGSK